MKLNELIKCPYEVEITGIKINSRDIEKGNLFVCTDMGTVERHDFIDDAITKGASAVIVKKDIGPKPVPIIKVDDPNELLASICSKFYGNPDKKLKIIGVTGTDGKTSVATIISKLIGDTCGYIGTNGVVSKNVNKPSPNTTPDSDKLYIYLNDFLNDNVNTVALEVSSESLMRGRIRNLEFDISVMTNITKEHLNIHKTLENYIDSKCELFRKTKKDGFCILNRDDQNYETVKGNSNAAVVTYGMNPKSDLVISNIKLSTKGTIFDITYKDETHKILSPMLATFNVYNLSAAILTLLVQDYPIDKIQKNLPNIKVDGRLEFVDMNQNFDVIVDYAHTPNGITELLKFVNTIKKGKVITIIGEPGERDKTKRPSKGLAALENSNFVIITSQDPRSENPVDIANDLLTLKGDHRNYEIILDRSKAIEKAISLASKDDIVLILGKGNETYQQFKDKTVHFSDIEEAKKYLAVHLSKERAKVN